MSFSLSPFALKDLVSRDGFGSLIPRQPAHLHTQAESGAYLTRFQRRRPCIYLNPHTSSGQSRVYRITQLRTDGVHCRESSGTGPVVFKVVPNVCCLGRSPWTSKYAPLVPTPNIGMRGHVESISGECVFLSECCVFENYRLNAKNIPQFIQELLTGNRSY